MLENMGAKCMFAVVQPYDGTPQNGDVVFNMAKGNAYVLRGVGVMYDADQKKRDKINADIASHHGYDMKSLIAYLKSVKKKGYANLKDMRDWYANPDNKPLERWGPRPRVAMDAVLHQGEGNSGAWILADAERAGIGPNRDTKDQYQILKDTIGID